MPEPQPHHITVEPTWNGLERGQEVRVKGVRGTFTFVSHSLNTRNNEEWVAVWETPIGSMRYFDPERVSAKRK